MSTSEQERVEQVMSHEKAGEQTGRKLRWDPYSKSLRAVSEDSPDTTGLDIAPSDMEHFHG